MTDNNSIKKYSLALGFFDGLHKAHTAVIKKAVAQKDENTGAAVLLFDKHPRKVLSDVDVPFILQKEKRDEIIASLGAEAFEVSFEKIKDMTPEEFVDELLIKKFNACAVSCGFNYSFGKNGTGDSAVLRRLCEERCIKVFVCPEIKDGIDDISSTVIRKAIENGDMKKANSMLGRPFEFTATVIHGDHRGRKLGAPTINQMLPDGMVIPRFGVYASRVNLYGTEFTGVTNIGSRPTFDGTGFRSETFILGYEGYLYGEDIELKLYDFLRPEKKFASVEELKEQIMNDAKTAESLLF